MDGGLLFNERVKKPFTLLTTEVYRRPGPAHTVSVHASVHFRPANA